ncbi:MAG TPA: MBL fold metallo-hydrolase, partial [Syntrophomonas sp.]|nr:MBL fold metallo-hydrolase [Syntrophomonas sp.]
MYELIQAGERTWYINSPAKVGIFKINEQEVCLIDSGNDKEAGR